jgi:hypothetical protein
MPVSGSMRDPFFMLHRKHDATQFFHEVLPPRQRGTTWSIVMDDQSSLTPQY